MQLIHKKSYGSNRSLDLGQPFDSYNLIISKRCPYENAGIEINVDGELALDIMELPYSCVIILS